MTLWLSLALVFLFAPVWLASGYLLVLALLARKAAPPSHGTATLKFDIVVPAHNEELCIERTVRSLETLDYPAALRHIHVIADNCSDRTAELARGAGADVLVRTDAEKRGKGYALELGFARSLERGWADALVVIDADTQVSANLLLAFQTRIQAGASAVQAEYGVLNKTANWRTRLMTIAFATFHVLRSSARERLGLSVGLRGNGMAFTSALVREVPHQAFSIVEDLEYGLRVGEAGHRVHYAWEAEVQGEIAVSEKASRAQRRRWEGGRFAMARRYAPRLLGRGLAQGNPVLLDLAFDLLVPPLTYVVAGAGLGTALAAALVLWGHAASWLLALALAADLFVAVYVLRGWSLSEVGWRGLWDLACAPVYIIWKLGLLLRRPPERPGEWVRTAREGKVP